jgi:hypothetical protein
VSSQLVTLPAFCCVMVYDLPMLSLTAFCQVVSCSHAFILYCMFMCPILVMKLRGGRGGVEDYALYRCCLLLIVGIRLYSTG